MIYISIYDIIAWGLGLLGFILIILAFLFALFDDLENFLNARIGDNENE